MNYAIRSSLYLLLLILDNIVSSDRVSVSSEVSQYGTIIIYYPGYKEPSINHFLGNKHLNFSLHSAEIRTVLLLTGSTKT